MEWEDLNEVQHDEDKALPEKNKKRRFKTPAQLQALEEFYDEHKYPTEPMKAELAVKLGLTEKQVSGWFCHRRLKDKRILIDAPGKQDLSSGVIQDRGSGLKQDSCSSTKQGDYRLADLREVESQRFSRDELPVAELNYEQRRVYNGAEMGNTSSESNSGLQKSSHPQNRKRSDVGATEYQAPNGFIPKRRGPSGYLKIKGQAENSAITAVKRQLGQHYREDGPPLGIDFDPLPPGAFESPSKNAINDGYGVPEASVPSSHDMLGIHKRPGNNNTRKQDMYVETADRRPFHKVDEGDFSYRQPKQKPSFPSQNRAFPSGQKSSLGIDTYSARETSDYDASKNLIIQRKHDRPARLTSGTVEAWSSGYDNLNPKVVRRKERSDVRSAAPLVRHKDSLNLEDRVPSSRILEDKELYVERWPMGELHDSARLKLRSTNDPVVRKRGREEHLLAIDYAKRTSTQELPQWSRQLKGSTMEVPSSFSEDETAETSSSMD